MFIQKPSLERAFTHTRKLSCATHVAHLISGAPTIRLSVHVQQRGLSRKLNLAAIKGTPNLISAPLWICNWQARLNYYFKWELGGRSPNSTPVQNNSIEISSCVHFRTEKYCKTNLDRLIINFLLTKFVLLCRFVHFLKFFVGVIWLGLGTNGPEQIVLHDPQIVRVEEFTDGTRVSVNSLFSSPVRHSSRSKLEARVVPRGLRRLPSFVIYSLQAEFTRQNSKIAASLQPRGCTRSSSSLIN